MSRFILGDCVQVMSRFPSRAVDFILTDPPYLVGYKDRTGRTIAGDNTSEWLQPACHEIVPRAEERQPAGELLRLEPRRSVYQRLESGRLSHRGSCCLCQNLRIEIHLCRIHT